MQVACGRRQENSAAVEFERTLKKYLTNQTRCANIAKLLTRATSEHHGEIKFEKT